MSNEFIVKFVLLTKSNVASTLLLFLATMYKLDISFRLCQKDEISFDTVAKNGNNVEAKFDFAERIVPLVAFDNVAGVDAALGTLFLDAKCVCEDASGSSYNGNAKDVTIGPI